VGCPTVLVEGSWCVSCPVCLCGPFRVVDQYGEIIVFSLFVVFGDLDKFLHCGSACIVAQHEGHMKGQSLCGFAALHCHMKGQSLCGLATVFLIRNGLMVPHPSYQTLTLKIVSSSLLTHPTTCLTPLVQKFLHAVLLLGWFPCTTLWKRGPIHRVSWTRGWRTCMAPAVNLC